jgi:hypothetical protein
MTSSTRGLLSFSLYGNAPKYCVGALRNQELAGEHYHGFSTRFYVGKTVPSWVTRELEQRGAEICHRVTSETCAATFWRFEALTDRAYDVVLVRDTDSRIGPREVAAVRSWIASGAALHVMRDHPQHDAPILGGLFGVRPSAMPTGWCIPDRFDECRRYGDDQTFLAATVYEMFRRSRVVHDSFFAIDMDSRQFPEPRDGLLFVGEVIDEQDHLNTMQRAVLARALQSVWIRTSLTLRSFAGSRVGRAKSVLSGGACRKRLPCQFPAPRTRTDSR